MLAKVAKLFNVPAVLTAVETESFSGYIWPQLLDVFEGQKVIERTSMNSWDDEGFRAAIRATGKKNIIITGLWTEVCVTWPTIEMLGEGYNIYVVEDCCGATSKAAHEAALSRMVQAGAVRLTAIPALLEWQRDWKDHTHYDDLMDILKVHAGAYGVGVEVSGGLVLYCVCCVSSPNCLSDSLVYLASVSHLYQNHSSLSLMCACFFRQYAYSMVHKAPQSGKYPHVVVKK